MTSQSPTICHRFGISSQNWPRLEYVDAEGGNNFMVLSKKGIGHHQKNMDQSNDSEGMLAGRIRNGCDPPKFE
jgi:hypothetical protein